MSKAQDTKGFRTVSILDVPSANQHCHDVRVITWHLVDWFKNKISMSMTMSKDGRFQIAHVPPEPADRLPDL